MLNNIFFTAQELLRKVPKQEFHIHTSYSDGKNTVEEYVKYALKERYRSICFTEHVDFSTSWFYEYQNHVETIKNIYEDLAIYYGVEVRARDFKGSLNADKEILKDSELVMGVVHRIPSEDCINVYDPKKFSREELLELEFSATIGLLKNRLVRIIGHPMSNYEKNYGETPDNIIIEILEFAKRKKVAIELNPAYIVNFSKFIELNLKLDTFISLGSNVHSLKSFGLTFENVRELIEQ